MNNLNKSGIRTKSLVAASLLTAISIILTRVFSIMIPIAGIQGLRVGFGGIPIIMSGILFGPLVGALTGTTADLIGFIINPMGPYFPGFTLTAALSGFIPGAMYHYIFKKNREVNFNIVNAIIVIILSIVSGIVYYMNIRSISISLLVVYSVAVLGFIVLPFLINKNFKRKYSDYRLDKLLFTISINTMVTSITLNTLWLVILYNKGFILLFPIRVITALITIPLESIIIYGISRYFKFMK